MRKIFFLFILLSLCCIAFGQTFEEKKPFIHKGLLRATLTIAPGTMFRISKSGILIADPVNIYLHGNLEYYIDDHISIRGDGFYSMKAEKPWGYYGFRFNHSLLAGPSYHFKSKNHFDFYFGFEPGIAIAKAGDSYISGNSVYSGFGQTAVNPIMSPFTGFNIYFERLFHVFAEGRYIYGKHLASGEYAPQSLSELRFSFGLGFNLDPIKKK